MSQTTVQRRWRLRGYNRRVAKTNCNPTAEQGMAEGLVSYKASMTVDNCSRKVMFSDELQVVLGEGLESEWLEEIMKSGSLGIKEK